MKKNRGNTAIASLMFASFMTGAILFCLQFVMARKTTLTKMRGIQSELNNAHQSGGRSQKSWRIPFAQSQKKKPIEHPVFMDFGN